MACICERKSPTSVTYRVRFRVKGYPDFSVTFDDYDKACEWAEANEDAYVKDPDKYLAWKEANYRMMRRCKVRVKDHVVKTKVYWTR